MTTDAEKFRAFKERFEKVKNISQGYDRDLKRDYVTKLEYVFEDLPNWINNQIAMTRDLCERLHELQQDECKLLKLDKEDQEAIEEIAMDIEEILAEMNETTFGVFAFNFDDNPSDYLDEVIKRTEKLLAYFRRMQKNRTDLFEICEST